MKFKNIPSDTEVFPSALSRFHRGGEKAVLLIHGHHAYTGELVYLFERLVAEGFSVSLPRLPGHGTNAKDFHQSGYRDWLRCVADEYLNLKSQFKKVYVAGLSMGGVLSLLLAEQFNPDGIALLAPAVSIRNKVFYLTPFLKYFIRRVRTGWSPREEESEERKAIGQEYWQYHDSAKVHDLLILQKMSIKKLRNVTSPALTIVSLGDKTVPPEAADLIENNIKSKEMKRVVLKDSPHVIVDGCDKEQVADEVIDWFKLH